MSVKVTTDRVAAVLKSIKGLERNQVMVGIPSETAPRQPDPDDPSPLTNAQIGYILDKGSPAANIPARPFLAAGVASVKDEWVEKYKQGSKAVLDGRLADADKVHMAAGLIAEKGVKAKINDGPFEALSPVTIAARKRRGRKSQKPLVDAGQMRNSVTHVIRSR